MAKEYSSQRGQRLAKTVTEWLQDPSCPERCFGWVSEVATGYVRPLQRIAVRCRRQDGSFAYGVLICSLSLEQLLAVLGHPCSQASDAARTLLAYVSFYDQRGGGIETSFKGDKQGMGLTTRQKKRFEAQYMLLLLGSLAHNVLIWARRWLSNPKIEHYGLLRLVRDVFHVSGLLRFDASGSLVEILLNQQATLAHCLLSPLQALLAPLPIVVTLGET